MSKGDDPLPPLFSRVEFQGTQCILKKVRVKPALAAEFLAAERIRKWQQEDQSVCRSTCRIVAVEQKDEEVLITSERLHCNVQSTLSQQWSEYRLVRELKNIICAMISAQKLSIAHRQISLEHILCTADGQFKLTNFARDLNNEEVAEFLRKQHPRYIFPEVRQNLEKEIIPHFDRALKCICDMWAMGVCFLELALPQVAVGAELDRDCSRAEQFLSSLPPSDLSSLLQTLLDPRRSAPQSFVRVNFIKKCFLCLKKLSLEVGALQCCTVGPAVEKPQEVPECAEDRDFLRIGSAGKGPILLMQESGEFAPPEAAFGRSPLASPEKVKKRLRIVKIEEIAAVINQCKTCKRALVKIGEKEGKECKLCLIAALSFQLPKPKLEVPKQPNSGSMMREQTKPTSLLASNHRGMMQCAVCLEFFPLPHGRPLYEGGSDSSSQEPENFCSFECKIRQAEFESEMSLTAAREAEKSTPQESVRERLLCIECNKEVPIFAEALQCSPLHGFCEKSCANKFVSRQTNKLQVRCSRCQKSIPPEIVQKWTEAPKPPSGGMLKPGASQPKPSGPAGLNRSTQDLPAPRREPPAFVPQSREPIGQKRCSCGTDSNIALTCGHFICEKCLSRIAQGKNVTCPTCKKFVGYK